MLVVVFLSPSVAAVPWRTVEGDLLIIYPFAVCVLAFVALLQTFGPE